MSAPTTPSTEEPKPLKEPDLAPTTLSDSDLSKAVVLLLHGAENDPEDAPFKEILSPRKRAYLIALALTGVKARAGRVAGISPMTMYTQQWKEDSAFQAAQAQAMVMAADVLEAELYRRAVEGVVEPVGWYKGMPGGLVRRFSDVLLIFALKGALPDKYKDRMEIRGTLANIDLNQLTQGQLARIAAGEHPIAVVSSGERGPVLLPLASTLEGGDSGPSKADGGVEVREVGG